MDLKYKDQSFLSKTEVHSSEIEKNTPVKSASSHSQAASQKNSPTKSTYSNHSRNSNKSSRFAWRDEEDKTASDAMLSAQYASDKARNILYSPYITPCSPIISSTPDCGKKSDSLTPRTRSKCSPRSPTSEADTSSIKGFGSHVTRMRTSPKNNREPIPSPKLVCLPNPPNLTPSKKETEELLTEINQFLANVDLDE